MIALKCFVQFAKLKTVFLFTNGKMSWKLEGAACLETVLLGTGASSVKIDGFEGFSNITHADLCDM